MGVCGNCGDPIVTVTIGGVTVWCHDRDENPSVYNYGHHGPRMCGTGNRNMATPEEETV